MPLWPLVPKNGSASGAKSLRRQGTSGVPIPSNRPNDPEPPKVPDPTPGQPDPIPKGVIKTPAPTQEEGTARG